MFRWAIISVAAIASCMLFPVTESAAQSSLMTDSDFALLPPACKIRLRGERSEWRPLVQQLGRDTFEDFHHLCFGMFFQNKAKISMDRRTKADYLKRSIGEFDYVLRHWPADTPLRPEAESLKRQSEMLLRLAQ